jgi:hypothetical protein
MMKLDHVYRPPDLVVFGFFLVSCFRWRQKHSYVVLFCLPMNPIDLVSIYVSDICTLQRDYVVALVQLCAFEQAEERRSI